MAVLTRSERLALLLNLLGDDAASLVRSGLQGEKLEEVESALKDFEEYPPSEDEIESVLDEFERYFELVVQNSEKKKEEDEAEEEENAEDEEEEGPPILQIAEEQFDVEIEPTKKFEQPTLTGNTLLDLNHAHPYQVAHALRNERPAIISLVVRRLADEHAAKTLELLPDALRSRVFMSLAKPSNVKPLILETVLQTTLAAALNVDERESSQDAAEKMSALIRSLPKSVRGPMMEELANEDAELAESVKKQLYRFEDLERLQDRDMQKILGQCRTEVLVVALQQVDQSLLEKVLGNMSKRAKESLQEEMEFKTNATEEEIEDGRAEVVKILVELDESGAISL